MNNNEPPSGHLSIEFIRRKLKKIQPSATESHFPPGFLEPELRRAAVLIPLVSQSDEWQIVFIRRSINHHDPHSGQVAFPGGRARQDETNPEETALREAQEELGLLPEDVTILGRLGAFATITGYEVTPIIGTLPWPYPLKPDPLEVERAFTIPLSWLADPRHRRHESRTLPEPFGRVDVIYFDRFAGEILWGASARFTLSLLETLALT